jgi:hypothetical protein
MEAGQCTEVIILTTSFAKKNGLYVRYIMTLSFYYKQEDCDLFKGDRYDVPEYPLFQPAV